LRKGQEKFIPGETRINYGGRIYDEKEIINLVDAALDFWLTESRFAKEFVKRLCDFLSIKYCILTNSGSSANLLATSALTSEKLGKKRLKPGDEVITTACTFPTTLNPIVQNNLIPVFVDIKLPTYNIKTQDLESAISKKTKAIFVAHTLGNPLELSTIMKIVEKYGLWFVEDNCDALGSKYNGEYTGTFGHMSTLSFYPAHHITTGEGGAVLTNDETLKRIIRSFRDWGRDCWCEPGYDNTCRKRFNWQLGKLPLGYDHKYIFSHIGYNLKITDLQAAIGIEQVKKLPSFIKKRRYNFNLLYEELKKYEEYLILPCETSGAEASWFGFILTVREHAPFSRNELVNFLDRNKIATRMLFAGNIIRQPAYQGINYRIHKSLKNTDFVMNNTFWIGVYPGLSEEMIEYILDKFEEFMKRY
jgi:CDP-6-deoxy-D-xylo-4-hexulose-3-dehydrase